MGYREDLLLGKDLETNIETAPVGMQQRDKHCSETIVTVGNCIMKHIARQLQQLDYNNVSACTALY